uniref:NET domain-containing protein n=1 Tax=viral metagenome TaxID=1070528 RepID=A0A6C0EQ12_9ZZZZ
MLKDQIDKLEMNEHKQIYSIIKKLSPQVTKTQNGVLVSTDTLDDDTLTEVERYVLFCLDQRKRMDDDMKTRKTYERMM